MSTWLFSSKLELACVPLHFERDVYIQQVLLHFRNHGLSGSLDSLEQFWAYRDGPCIILGSIALLRETCKNFLFLAVWAPSPKFRFWAHILLILETFWVFWTFFGMIWHIFLFLAGWAPRLTCRFWLRIQNPCEKSNLMSIKSWTCEHISIFSNVYF